MGYRESSYDPLASAPGPVLKPYNAWQWLGVGLTLAGMLLSVVSLGAILGWLPRGWNTMPGAILLVSTASLLITSRRGPPTERTPEERRRSARLFAVTILIGATVALALILVAKGA